MWIWFPIIVIYIIISVAVYSIVQLNSEELESRHARRIIAWPIFILYDLIKSFYSLLLLSMKIDIRRYWKNERTNDNKE